MARLYLIRRNLESFVGPLTVAEMRQAYKRMSFGLQDEVSGHCGKWITFDDIPKLKRHYPEIAKLVQEDMLAGWGMSDHTGQNLVAGKRKKRSSRSSSSSFGLAWAFLAVAMAAFGFAAYVYLKGQSLSGQIGTPQPAVMIEPESVKVMVDANDIEAFYAFMAEHEAKIVERALKSKQAFAAWAPYLRMYAYANDGQIPGVSQKLLRGANAGAAPFTCSAKAWRQRWRASAESWPELISGRAMPREHWARLLAWDPHWVRRRQSDRWLAPANYYEACLIMADKALQEIAADNVGVDGKPTNDWEALGLSIVQDRVRWLLAAATEGRGGSLRNRPVPQTMLELWTCHESARSEQELAGCSLDTELVPAVTEYNNSRQAWNSVRLKSSQVGMGPAQFQNMMDTATQLPREDYFTRFDYSPEHQFVKELVVSQGDTIRAAEKVQTEYPFVDFSP